MHNWTAEDFITYLYHIVADSDFETGKTELEVVKKQAQNLIAKHFGNQNYSYENSLTKIQYTEGVSVIRTQEVIVELINKFEFGKEVKADIYNDLNAIALSDDKLTPTEQETISFIKRVLQAEKMPLSW